VSAPSAYRAALGAALAAAAALAARPAAAQQDVQHGAAPAAPARRAPTDVRGGAAAFVAGAGADAVGRLAGDPALGLAAHGGVEVRVGGPRSPVALRVGIDYGRSERAYQAAAGFGPGPFPARRTTTQIGGSLLAVARLPARGGVRPYALVGAGLQHYNRRDEGDRVPLGGGAFGGGASGQVIYAPPVRANVASYTAGAGATGRVGRVVPFAEARLTVLPALGPVGGPRVRAPVLVGVRF
jgi:hypothetical protein